MLSRLLTPRLFLLTSGARGSVAQLLLLCRYLQGLIFRPRLVVEVSAWVVLQVHLHAAATVVSAALAVADVCGSECVLFVLAIFP